MRTLLIAALICSPAIAEVSVTARAPRVHLEPPSVHFRTAPPLVVVRPGVQVVEGSSEEVFFSGGWYWHRGSDGTWWRTHNHHGGWRVAPRRAVPVAVVRCHGHYRNFHAHARLGKHAHASIRTAKKTRRG